MFVQVKRKRAAATARLDLQRRNPRAIDHARHRGIDVRRQRRLHAAAGDQHRASMARRWPCLRRSLPRYSIAKLARQQALREASDRKRRIEHRLRQQCFAERIAPCSIERLAADAFIDNLAADIDESAILDAGRTRRLARTAGEAAIEMKLRRLGRRRAFEHLLHQVDATAGSVELIAQQLIGRTCRGAEAAVHAGAQDRIGFAAFRRIANERREIRFHQTSGYSRPRFRMRCGSNVALSR